MPQMAPLSWTSLFLAFILIYMFVSTKIYFLSHTSTKNLESIKTINKKMMNWKW